MRVQIIIYGDNSAFEESGEVGRVLNGQVLERIRAAMLAGAPDGGNLQDSNGNTVGKWEVTTVEKAPWDISNY